MRRLISGMVWFGRFRFGNVGLGAVKFGLVKQSMAQRSPKGDSIVRYGRIRCCIV